MLLNVYLTVSVDVQKKGTDTKYPIGIDRCNHTIFYSYLFYFGVRKSMERIS